MAAELGDRRLRASINVTPLVDVVLVLLIVFMVVTPMLTRGKPVVLPRGRELSELHGRGDPVVVSVTRDGRFWVDQAEVPRDGVAGAVTEQLRRRRGAAVLVKADKDVRYREVRALARELAKARLPGVSLAGTERRAGEAP
jgi:biopolymer transport protein ExbD/biopolymer transport protein TolR